MFISRVFLPIPNTAFAQCRTSLIFPKSDQNRRFSISSTDFHSSNMLAPWQTSILHHSTLALTFRRRKDTSSNAQSKGNTLGEQKWVHEGLITESLANGDRVKIEVSRYDSSRGRIIYRLGGNKDSKEARKKR